MATVTIFGTAADGFIDSSNNGGGTYSNARAGTGASLNASSVSNNLNVGQKFASFYDCYEALIGFDTSTVVSPTAVTLSLFGATNASTTDFTVEARLHDWSTTVTTADWVAGASLGTKTLLATWASSGYAASYLDFTESGSAFASNLNLSGFTRVLLCSDRHRVGTTPTGDEYVIFNSADTAGTTSDPKIVVTYTAGGTNATATPAVVALTTTVDPPTVSAATNRTVTPATVAGVGTLAAPTVTAPSNATATPGTVPTAASVGGPVVTAPSNVTAAPATVSGIASLGAPSTTATSEAAATPATLSGAVTLDAPTVTTVPDLLIAPATVAATTAIGAPVVSAGQAAEPTTIQAVATMAQPVVSVPVTAEPGTVLAGSSFGAPAVAVGVTATPATISIGGRRRRPIYVIDD